DITGQRISKVVRTLNLIEEQIGAMISGLEKENKEQKIITESKDEPQDIIGDLLNGPAHEGEGVNQDDIDALFG
ncbi:MAG: chemotaxis protein, partial [Hyphomicrobiales bacterium]